jgi:uncharacterized protein
MSADDLPLLELFTKLREAGLLLGIDEYRLALRALQLGYGIKDRVALARVCRALWVKSSEEKRLFDYNFEKFIPETSAEKVSRQTEENIAHKTDLQSEKLPVEESTAPISKASSKQSETTPPIEDLPTTEPSMNLSSTQSQLFIHELEDEIRIAQAVKAGGKEDSLTYAFTQTTEFFPVTRRQMKQSWRYLRRMVREGPPEILDVEATINRMGRQGIFLEPMLIPRRVNRIDLLLLLDQGGSMSPFHILSRRLAETASRGGRLGQAGAYFFYNCPSSSLYFDGALRKAEPIKTVLSQIKQRRTVALIFSDAGAARGGYNAERIRQTEEFLNQLRPQVRHVTWLNPMPNTRWAGTTANEIARLVPMFEVSRRGLDDAIDVLRGRRV